MIPAFNISNVLPPFVGDDPTIVAATSPYEISMSELISTFGTSKERLIILKGLLRYRAQLKQLKITEGFQLVDGSFVENCEILKGRAPADIDIVTFGHAENDKQLLIANPELFDPQLAKENYYCDAYFVNLNMPSYLIPEISFYYFGLFSHQRVTSLWKGMLKVPLNSDDSEIQLSIEGEDAGGST